jgi:predicted glycoside hydrolase/deacetylase ChbG (UPF0249 family)
MKKKLIVTAHDFGYFNSVNDGIIYALSHKNNIITEVSVLPNFKISNRSAELLKPFNVSVSLNTNFTTGKPLSSNVKSMTGEDGNFKKADTNTWDFSCIDSFTDKDIRMELNAQYEWFIRQFGRKPAAILSRKNEYSDPKILMHIVELCKKEGVVMRVPYWKWQKNYAAESFVRDEGVKCPSNIFIGFGEWKGIYGYDLEHELDRMIGDAKKEPGVVELLLAIGFVDRELFDSTSLSWQRGQFLKLLDDDNLIRKIKENFELINFADL